MDSLLQDFDSEEERESWENRNQNADEKLEELEKSSASETEEQPEKILRQPKKKKRDGHPGPMEKKFWKIYTHDIEEAGEIESDDDDIPEQVIITDEDRENFGDPKEWRQTVKLKGSKYEYGPIRGNPVFKLYPTRLIVSQSGLHTPVQQGINGYGNRPAASIVAMHAGGYQDEDYGEVMHYTGQGGDEKNDQELSKYNLSLSLNMAKKVPVRVVRGHHLPSKYAPKFGYRYDGLYWVTKVYQEPTQTGSKVYKFRLVRLPGQGVIPVKKGYQKKLTKMNSLSRSEYLASQSKQWENRTFAALPAATKAYFPIEKDQTVVEKGNLSIYKNKYDANEVYSDHWKRSYNTVPLVSDKQHTLLDEYKAAKVSLTTQYEDANKRDKSCRHIQSTSKKVDFTKFLFKKKQLANDLGALTEVMSQHKHNVAEELDEEDVKRLHRRSLMSAVRIRQGVTAVQKHFAPPTATPAPVRTAPKPVQLPPRSAPIKWPSRTDIQAAKAEGQRIAEQQRMALEEADKKRQREEEVTEEEDAEELELLEPPPKQQKVSPQPLDEDLQWEPPSPIDLEFIDKNDL